MKKSKGRQKALKGAIKLLCAIIVFTSLFVLYIDFVQYPEKYITTWKYHLYNDLARGDSEAIDYYQRMYIDKGEHLFDTEDTIFLHFSNHK